MSDDAHRHLRAKAPIKYDERSDDDDDDDDDSASDKSYEDEEEDDNEYDEESEYDEDDNGNTVKVSRKKKKTAAEIAAEKQVAVHLGLAYPKEFYSVRAAIGYIYRAVCRKGRIPGIRLAYDTLIFQNHCTEAEVQACIAFASTFSSTIDVPCQDIANAFAPYSSFNGGYYTKTSGHVGTLFGIALMAQMVHVLPTYREQGSAQHQGFASLLANAGMHGDVLEMLAHRYTTDTPLNSAEADAKKLAEQLNELDGAHRLQVLYANLSGFEKRARSLQPPGYSPAVNAYDRSKFDNTRPKGAQQIAHRNGTAMVSLTILHRTDEDTRDGRAVDGDAETTKLGEIYGAAGTYKPFFKLSDSYTICGNPGGYVETHRAHVNVPAPVSPSKIIIALRKMLLTKPIDEGSEEGCIEHKSAPMLKQFLDKAYPVQRSGTVDSFEWGVDHKKAYLGVRYNGVDLSIGKERPRCRSLSKQCYLHKAPMGVYKDEPQRWLWLGAFPHDFEVANLLCPPWKAYDVGTVDFYLLLSDRCPQDVLNIRAALQAPLEIAAAAVGKAARDKADDEWRITAMSGENTTQRKKRRLNDQERIDLAEFCEKAYQEAYNKHMARPELQYTCTPLKLEYPFESGVWPADHHDMTYHVSAATKRRAEDLRWCEVERAKVFKRAEKNHTDVVAAEPGGKDASAAAASFATKAATQMV